MVADSLWSQDSTLTEDQGQVNSWVRMNGGHMFLCFFISKCILGGIVNKAFLHDKYSTNIHLTIAGRTIAFTLLSLSQKINSFSKTLKMLEVSQNNLIHNQDSCVLIYKMGATNLQVPHCTVMKQKVPKIKPSKDWRPEEDQNSPLCNGNKSNWKLVLTKHCSEQHQTRKIWLLWIQINNQCYSWSLLKI